MSAPTGYLVAGPEGVFGGPFVGQDEAIAEREALIAEGFECWLVPTFPDEPRFLTNVDPGDENDYRRPPC